MPKNAKLQKKRVDVGTYHIMMCITHKNLKKLGWCLIVVPSMQICMVLMSGPDLANQFVKVHERTSAFMEDIKSMFYKVLVPSHQRSLLRYLWWEESNLSKKVVDYQM